MRFLALLSLLFCLAYCQDDDVISRAKRSYYGGYDTYGYGDGDFWFAGRIFGIIAACLLFLLCCCVPCICLLGIWFLGWFGLRRGRGKGRNDNKARPATVSHVSPTYQSPPRSRHVVVDTAPRQHEPRHGDEIVYQAEDRYYSSSAPVSDTRPHTYRATNF